MRRIVGEEHDELMDALVEDGFAAYLADRRRREAQEAQGAQPTRQTG